MAMPTERFTFTGHSGDELATRLDLPEGPVLATALFAHCFTCSKDIPAAKRISARLAGAGIAVLRFDFTGLGHSEGEALCLQVQGRPRQQQLQQASQQDQF